MSIHSLCQLPVTVRPFIGMVLLKFTATIILLFAIIWSIVAVVAEFRLRSNIIRVMLSGIWQQTPRLSKKDQQERIMNVSVLVTLQFFEMFALVLVSVACYIGWFKNRRDVHLRKWIRFSARIVFLIPAMEIGIFVWQMKRVPKSLDKTTSIAWIVVTILLAILHTLIFHGYIYMLLATEHQSRKSVQTIETRIRPSKKPSKKGDHIVIVNVGNRSSSHSIDSDDKGYRHRAGDGSSERAGDRSKGKPGDRSGDKARDRNRKNDESTERTRVVETGDRYENIEEEKSKGVDGDKSWDRYKSIITVSEAGDIDGSRNNQGVHIMSRELARKNISRGRPGDGAQHKPTYRVGNKSSDKDPDRSKNIVVGTIDDRIGDGYKMIYCNELSDESGRKYGHHCRNDGINTYENKDGVKAGDKSENLTWDKSIADGVITAYKKVGNTKSKIENTECQPKDSAGNDFGIKIYANQEGDQFGKRMEHTCKSNERDRSVSFPRSGIDENKTTDTREGRSASKIIRSKNKRPKMFFATTIRCN